MNEDQSQVVMSQDDPRLRSAKTIALVVYALQALAFVAGITGIVAIVINYVKLNDVRGSWLESHFRWQIRTFWYSILWSVIGFILVFALIGYAILLATAVWVIYRIVKGWLRLADNKAMYVD